MNDLHRAMFLPDLLIAALARNGDRPAVYIDGEMRTAAELSEEISRHVQAFSAQGIELGDGVATSAKNRVEVLYSMGAVMLTRCPNTPLHPLGSLDDHAYVLEDAGIETLLFDPAFTDRARELAERRYAPALACRAAPEPGPSPLGFRWTLGAPHGGWSTRSEPARSLVPRPWRRTPVRRCGLPATVGSESATSVRRHRHFGCGWRQTPFRRLRARDGAKARTTHSAHAPVGQRAREAHMRMIELEIPENAACIICKEPALFHIVDNKTGYDGKSFCGPAHIVEYLTEDEVLMQNLLQARPSPDPWDRGFTTFEADTPRND